jgi:hypothetical protein
MQNMKPFHLLLAIYSLLIALGVTYRVFIHEAKW